MNTQRFKNMDKLVLEILKSYNFYNEALLHDVHNSLALKRIIIVKRLLAI